MAIVERLRGVVIEHRDALACMRQHDAPTTLHYIDPPYVHDTRSFHCTRAKAVYSHEMSDADHVVLADGLKQLTGMVVLSGYRCDLYDSLFCEWERHDKQAFADGARPRIESLWLNPAASAAQSQMEIAGNS